MKLIAANMVDKVDSFLHAGYISAYPRPLESYGYPLGSEEAGSNVQVLYHMDLAEALRLEGETLAAGSQTGGSETALAAIMDMATLDQLLMGALACTAFIILFYLVVERLDRFSKKLVPVFLSVCILVLVMPHCDNMKNESEPLPTDPPWQDLQKRSYANPDDATIALLHGVIIPAVANIGQKVDVLANIQNEVGLPTRHLTEGQAYALSTYGIDGFGKEFRFTRNALKDVDEKPYSGYTVSSAGADGMFDTGDDIVKHFEQTINETWGWHRNAFYLGKSGDDVVVLFHRWNGDMFEYNNESLAEQLTGSSLFDLFEVQNLDESRLAAVNKAYYDIADPLEYDPLILQVFDW
ncbi:MAG: hypothetical protein GY854_17690 [Deltaproteobacteria bacterium]|nr:hypothetical protein [Deltaproteobacteria bacterium]